MNQVLPLFALGQPLFPGVCLNLQVFEQRYLRLVRDSMRNEQSFGIIANAQDEVPNPQDVSAVYHVGLEVNIVDWNQQDNGLLGISVQGDRRFSICSLDVEQDGLLIAETEVIEDDNVHDDITEEEFDGLKELLLELGKHPTLGWFECPEDMSGEALVWRLAQVLPVEVQAKVDLLADLDARGRLRKVQSMVEALSTS